MKKWNQRLCCLLIAACAMVFGVTETCSALIVSEVMYHPTDDGETLEFIELYNNRAVFEDISGFAFTDGIEYVFGPETIIGAKEYLVLARDPEALEAAYGITGVYGPYSGRMSNDGEGIEFSNANGEIVISFNYSTTHPWPVSPDGTGHSLVLGNPGKDPEDGAAWSASTYIGGTPGMPDQIQVEPEDPTLVTLVDIGHDGRYFKGTTEPSPGPQGQPTTTWTQIQFNDNPATTAWIDGPSGYGYSNDSSELQYVRTQLNDMNGSYVSVYARLPFTVTQEQIDGFAQLQAEVHYDDGFVLYLNGTRLVDSGQIPGNPPAFDTLVATASDYDPAVIDLTGYVNLLVAGTNVLAIQAHNASLAGSSDCFGAPVLRAVIEPVQEADDPRARVLINEVLPNSDAEPGLDWIELYNPGPITVDLSHVYLSDDPTDLLQYKIPDGTVLQPGQFWAVTEETIPFALDFSGETIYITAATDEVTPQPSRVMDAFRYDATAPDVTFGRYPDGSDRQVFLASPTFGSANDGPRIDDIVINEIMYHHSTQDKRYEYIELYNNGPNTVSLGGWAFTDGIQYLFAQGLEMAPGEYLVIAQDPSFLAGVYDHLTIGINLFGPYAGNLNDHTDHVCLSYPMIQTNPQTNETTLHMVTVDEVRYYDGGRWPSWADGLGASLELRDPHGDNDTPGAWADSDESGKTTWSQFSFTINSNNTQYSHSSVNVFDMMLLNRGEVLLDDIQVFIDGTGRLTNNGFESGTSSWRILGNHVNSFVTAEDSYAGSRSLHLMASGHGDPGANRINQTINSVTAGTVTFRGFARWLRGCPFLLLRTTRELSPTQPPRPAHAFELDMPLDLGTPGLQNTAYVTNRGPDIVDVKHSPVLPTAGEPIVVTAHITDVDGVQGATLYYRSEGGFSFAGTSMVDNGSGDDLVAGDGLYTGTIPGTSGGTMRAFYIAAIDPSEMTRFPTLLPASSEVPERTCLVRISDTLLNTQFATYRIWLSNDVMNVFGSRPNLSNQLMDCTFIYNDTEVFYNCGLRHRGSPWLRSGSGERPNPGDSNGFRIEFNPDKRFGLRQEINLDGTEGSSRGPLQERAAYFMYRHMGLQYSTQEYIRPIINGTTRNVYDDVQKIDGDYIEKWFPHDADGYLHKVDDYFEYNAAGTSHSNLDEGLIYNSSHPLIPETYRWGFEKRSHRENDTWDHLFDFAVAMNTSSGHPRYEEIIESVTHPEHLTMVLAIRHAVGDWDSYGYNRGKNNLFYYAANEGKWYLLPWDIDFAFGSGDGSSTNLFQVAGHFPEIKAFLDHTKYEDMYWDAFRALVEGPWQTSYGTSDPPTPFDEFLDDAADALQAEGLGDGRRNAIKSFVRARRSYIIGQLPEPRGER